MGSGSSSTSTKVEEAEKIEDNSKQEEVIDKYCSMMNVHGTSAIGGAVATISIIVIVGAIVSLYYFIKWKARGNARNIPISELATPFPVIVQSPGLLPESYQNQLLQHPCQSLSFQQGPEFICMLILINREGVRQNAIL